MNIVLKLSVLVIDSFRTAWTGFALYLIITVNRVLSLIGSESYDLESNFCTAPVLQPVPQDIMEGHY